MPSVKEGVSLSSVESCRTNPGSFNTEMFFGVLDVAFPEFLSLGLLSLSQQVSFSSVSINHLIMHKKVRNLFR